MRIQTGLALKKKRLKHIYLRGMLWFLGRSIQHAGRMDPITRQEFRTLPEQFTFSLTVHPDGPTMTVGKTESGTVRYFGRQREDHRADLIVSIHSLEAAMLLLTFRESTAAAAARDRISMYGSIVFGCTAVRILDRVELLLLPRILAKRAVKRYQRPRRIRMLRLRLYTGAIFSGYRGEQ